MPGGWAILPQQPNDRANKFRAGGWPTRPVATTAETAKRIFSFAV